MNIYEKLLKIQSKLKAPKSQFNEFGRYNYRNCEDILEAAKPLCAECEASLFLSDEIVEIGTRFYVKASAVLVDIKNPADKITVTAFAREEENKKGMDGSQVTGASSSYARKYALNGLFNIDDTKDSDTTNTHGTEKPKAAPANAAQKPSQAPTSQKPIDPLDLQTALNYSFSRGEKANVPFRQYTEKELSAIINNENFDNARIKGFAAAVLEHLKKQYAEAEETPDLTDDDLPF